MTEVIRSDGQTLAIIVFSTFSEEGIRFFTHPESSLQLGYMNRKAGHKVAPHTHPPCQRTVYTYDEVLFIRSGKIKVSIYDEGDSLTAQRFLSAGDCILLVAGGHGVEVIETAEILEVKQGPFEAENHKVFLKTHSKTLTSQ